MDETRIDERLLDATAAVLFGNKGAHRLRRAYNKLETVMRDIAEDAFREGHAAGLQDGREVEHFRALLGEAARDLDADEERMAAEAAQVEQALYDAAADQAFDEPPRIHAHTDGGVLDPAFVTELRAREAAFNE